MKKIIFIFCLLGCLLGCRTVKFDKTTTTSPELPEDTSIKNFEDEQNFNKKELEEYAIEDELKEVDIEKTVVYVEKPVYYPVEKETTPVKGKDAAKASLKLATQEPYKYSGGTMYYDFQESFVYEIYCQAYRITDIALEPGEQVLENPFLSETQVWEIGAGVSRKYGQDVQHFYLKPDFSGLTTSMIIITDRRVYHLLLKSFKDCYMAMVEFEYPNTMPYNIKSDAMNAHKNALSQDLNKIDPKFLSFDYKMTYSFFKKPVWLPKRVYDDGKKTYIQLDETVLHTETPVLFNKKNERINYRVDKNLIIIDELTEKLTLRLGKEKVQIKKLKYKDSDSKSIEMEESISEQSSINTKTKEVTKYRKYHTGNAPVLNGSQFGDTKEKELKVEDKKVEQKEEVKNEETL